MIRMNRINKYYRESGGETHVLKDISLSIKQGEMIAIMGPSGSGKSTLVNILGFIDSEFEGEYLFENQHFDTAGDSLLAKLRNQTVGFVFQNFNLIENNTVLENIALPLFYNKSVSQGIREKILNLLSRMGIEGKENQYPRHLSGGQQQRVAIARALINNPKFIIADEPTGALDAETTNDIMKLFCEINQQGTTIILVTHNPEIISYCNRLIRIKNGCIVEDRDL
ncbi:ABC transporter ATP-binding protein [Bacillus wiedmannii]|uniref:ABC transporter ATP-binding protein n=1 Tax=Bacillus wiedmannii TaxID=1890302 RepID=UPI001CBAA3C5|nr:ABC transporter ATP-binding protein [Bacillus wiedmannii]MBZ4226410.1 ABC transporter ATP-binding protein [Bacillus wiedmannii]